MKQNLFSTRYTILYAVIAGFLMSLTPFSMAFLPSHHGPFTNSVQLLDAFILLFLNIVLFYISLWLNLVIVEKSKSHKILLNILAYLGFTLLAILIHKPIWSMLERMPIGFFIRDELGRNLIIFSISVVVANAFHSFQQNQQMKNKILEIQRQSLAGQIESLKQQINPHFFFNSLNTLSGLAQEDTQKMLEFIEKLSQVFRYVLEIQEKNVVTVAEEMNFARAYIYLLKVRFEEKFSIEISPDLDENALVPSLCTQLLLENCFKHNSMSSSNPLIIKIIAGNGYLVICNSIMQMNQTSGNGIGLKNLNERSKLLAGKAIEITTDNECFTVKVPTIYK
ncbi:MAG: histidine kinase [Paludibacter sp.]|nr:histidine kinase [Paludibacter sp.]